jgi:hypothetical protein
VIIKPVRTALLIAVVLTLGTSSAAVAEKYKPRYTESDSQVLMSLWYSYSASCKEAQLQNYGTSAWCTLRDDVRADLAHRGWCLSESYSRGKEWLECLKPTLD